MDLLRRKFLLNAFKLFDVLNAGFCLIVSIVWGFDKSIRMSFHQIAELKIAVNNIIFFLLALLIWTTIYSYLNLYRSKRLDKPVKEILDLIQASSIGCLLIFFEAKLFSVEVIDSYTIILFLLLSTIIGITSRIILRLFLRVVRVRGRNLRHMLIIGTNPRAIKFAEKIASAPYLGYQIIGFVDNQWFGGNKDNLKRKSLVCDFDSFQSYIRNSIVDEVIIGLPVKSLYDQASKIITTCEEQGINIRYLSNLFDVKAPISGNCFSDEELLIHITHKNMDFYPSFIKKTMDIILSIVLLIVFLPLLAIVSIAIKIDSPGAIIYSQKRIGKNKRIFKLYKFRTMYENAEKKQADLESLNEATGPVFKIENDPRVTPVGKYLRKTSIDELPQFINVLKGEMSIVGPRPLPVRDYKGFREDWHRRRFSVRPGITCLWQVNGRSSIPFDRWMELDMEYIDKWSLWLDLKIILKTIPIVLKGAGAF